MKKNIKLHPNSKYIWDDTDQSIGERALTFKRQFQAKDECKLTLFADTFYTILVNGIEVGVGPILTTHVTPYISEWDISAYLNNTSTENAIIIKVWFDGRNPNVISDADPFKAGLIATIKSDLETVVTDNSWLVKEYGKYTPAREDKRSFAGKRVMIADFTEEQEWKNAKERARYADKDDITQFNQSPIDNLTCVRRDLEIIDYGKSCGNIIVEFADDVSERVINAELKSIAVENYEIFILSPETETRANTLQSKEKISSLYENGKIIVPHIEDDFYILFDANMQTSGSLWIDIESETELIIDMAYADHLINGRVDPTTQSHPFADRFILNAGRNTAHLPFDKGYRYVQCNFSKAATIHDIYISEHVYNHDNKLRFNSSDKALNYVWQGALNTLHQCSLTTHVDNARRERQGWGGPDQYGMSHGVFYGFGDLRLTRKMLIDYIYCYEEHGFVPNWYPAVRPGIKWLTAHDLWFALSVWDYTFHSDDKELAEKLLQITRDVVNFYCSHTKDGLNSRPYDHACRWEEWSLNVAQDISTWENIMAVVSLESIAKLEEYLGVDNTKTLAQAEELNKNIFEKLWHPYHNALCQGTKFNDEKVDHASQVENAVCLLFGIAPEDKKQMIYDFCSGESGTWPTSRSGWQGSGQGQRVRYFPQNIITAGTPFTSSICAKVIARYSSVSEAVQYVRYNFGAMLDECNGTYGEMWPLFIDESNAATSFCQGYNGAITSTMITDILGLRFTAPGGRSVEWHILDNGLEMVEGSVETICGTVSVKREGNNLSYTAPDEVELTIIR